MYIVFKGEIVHIGRGNDGFYRDATGTIYALRDDEDVADVIDRCGIGWASLPVRNPLNPGCRVHDYAYTSSAYQAFHTRKEADEYLRRLIAETPSKWSVLAWPFYWLSRIFGGKYWENKKTRAN